MIAVARFLGEDVVRQHTGQEQMRWKVRMPSRSQQWQGQVHLDMIPVWTITVWFCAGHYAGHATRYQRAGSSIAEIQYAFRAL